MSHSSSDLSQFHLFVTEQLALGHDQLSPEECLDAWRASHPAPAELAQSIAAIELGLEQARRGEGVPLEEFIGEFRKLKGIAGDAG